MENGKSKRSKTETIRDAAEIASKAEAAGITVEEVLRIMETYDYPIRRMKKFIEDFFKVLEREKHYIYATFLHLPENYFQIKRTFDWRASTDNKRTYYGNIPPESYRLKLFYAMGSVLHCYDEFEIFVFYKNFNRNDIMTLDKVEALYKRFLRDQCEAALRRKEKIELTPEIIGEYGLTNDDVAIVRKYLHKYNIEAKRKIQKEFDVLNSSP